MKVTRYSINHLWCLWKIYLKIFRLFYIQNQINVFWFATGSVLMWTTRVFLGILILIMWCLFLNLLSNSRYLYFFMFNIKLIVDLSISFSVKLDNIICIFLQKDDIMLHFTISGSSDITGCQYLLSYLLFCLLFCLLGKCRGI